MLLPEGCSRGRSVPQDPKARQEGPSARGPGRPLAPPLRPPADREVRGGPGGGGSAPGWPPARSGGGGRGALPPEVCPALGAALSQVLIAACPGSLLHLPPRARWSPGLRSAAGCTGASSSCSPCRCPRTCSSSTTGASSATARSPPPAGPCPARSRCPGPCPAGSRRPARSPRRCRRPRRAGSRRLAPSRCRASSPRPRSSRTAAWRTTGCGPTAPAAGGWARPAPPGRPRRWSARTASSPSSRAATRRNRYSGRGRVPRPASSPLAARRGALGLPGPRPPGRSSRRGAPFPPGLRRRRKPRAAPGAAAAPGQAPLCRRADGGTAGAARRRRGSRRRRGRAVRALPRAFLWRAVSLRLGREARRCPGGRKKHSALPQNTRLGETAALPARPSSPRSGAGPGRSPPPEGLRPARPRPASGRHRPGAERGGCEPRRGFPVGSAGAPEPSLVASWSGGGVRSGRLPAALRRGSQPPCGAGESGEISPMKWAAGEINPRREGELIGNS